MRKQIFTIASLLVLASMVLTACGPQATAAPSTPQVIVQTQIVAGTPQQVVVTATPPPAAPAKEFKSKDPTTWVTAEFGSPETIETASDYETSGLEITQNTHDYLFFYKREVSSEVVPMLATEIPSTANGGISADGKTVTFKIRPDVKFHNGDPLTAHDVAFSLQRFILQGNNGSSKGHAPRRRADRNSTDPRSAELVGEGISAHTVLAGFSPSAGRPQETR